MLNRICDGLLLSGEELHKAGALTHTEDKAVSAKGKTKGKAELEWMAPGISGSATRFALRHRP